jgi:FkbM family methyltransferase
VRLAKDLLKRIPFVGPWLRRAYFNHLIRDDITMRIEIALRHCPSVSVVQIGSNDGVMGDPIAQLIHANPSWSCLFVEPVPYLFARLKSNYGQAARFRFENAAIASETGVLPFFSVSESARQNDPGLPPWCDQVGSFSRQHLVNHFGGALEPYIEELAVTALRFEDLLRKHGLAQFDLLHIDAEGFDWKILRQVDLTRQVPHVILFEHQHLTPEEKTAARKFLRGRYTISVIDRDWLCFRKDQAERTDVP